jgi:hypothetical protein
VKNVRRAGYRVHRAALGSYAVQRVKADPWELRIRRGTSGLYRDWDIMSCVGKARARSYARVIRRHCAGEPAAFEHFCQPPLRSSRVWRMSGQRALSWAKSSREAACDAQSSCLSL